MNKKVKSPIKLGHYPLLFDYCPNDLIEQYSKKRGLFIEDCDDSKAQMLHWNNFKPYPLCLVIFNNNTVKDHITVPTYFAHEAFHIVSRLWEHIGEKNPGEENTAYALDHVVNQLLLRYYEYHDS